jgi:hypothetical protein
MVFTELSGDSVFISIQRGFLPKSVRWSEPCSFSPLFVLDGESGALGGHENAELLLNTYSEGGDNV